MNIPLLLRLRDAGGQFLPFDQLGNQPEQVRHDLDVLEAFGFQFERHPFGSVAYRGPASRLCPDQIEHELNTRTIGRRIAVWSRTGSTNDLAAQAAGSRANEGLVVFAEEQTAGRGRRGRTWSAPAHSSLLMSVLLFPQGELAEPAWLTALGAVAVADVVSAWSGRTAAIKWPNDVRVDRRKIAGILVERGPDSAVVGIGLNANLSSEALPDDVRQQATSLQILTDAPIDRSELARDLLRRLDALYEASLQEGASALGSLWSMRSEHLGQAVIVETTGECFRGRLDSIDLWDGLRLRTHLDEICQVSADQIRAILPLESV